MTADRAHLAWPFFEESHAEFAAKLAEWAGREITHAHGENVDDACRDYARRFGEAGWLRHCVPAPYGGAREKLDVRTICLARETLAYRSGLAEFVFALQGLGAGPISLFGSEELKRKFLPGVARGESIPAFAISEKNAGSDVAAMQTTARRDGSHYVIEGEKAWISNCGIADFYVVFCKFPEGGPKNYVALVAEATTPGLTITERISVSAPHPLGTLRFNNCRVPADQLVGEQGAGLKVALGTLDVFRSTVGAAALGFARRALEEAITFAQHREVFGQPLVAWQMTQAKLADMATEIDAMALLVYRAAWTRDTRSARITREAAMAKLYATEAAQRIVDHAIQILGARGVIADSVLERLYREVRALRIYEGASEIQKLVIANQLLQPREEAHKA